ncbi:TraI/MobA(P) family conjugative relaxase [Massilia niabensis]|uniref:TraI/MobA(P) family conjugative relaxase n=1 Tax=Massilia niabensis TaxID=544910 RepID=A0ABW0LCJ3_9BURK
MPRKVGAENRAADMEHHAGIESLLGWIQRGCKAQMQRAQSWAQLHAVLSVNGLVLQPRANGLVITAEDGTTIKASSVGREFSKPKLEQRFGPFQSAPGQKDSLKTRRRYEKRPLALRPGTEKLYAQYQAAQAQVKTVCARERERVRDRKKRRIEAAMRSVRLKRAALKLVKIPRQPKKLMYGALTSALRDEISEIKRGSRQEYKSIIQKFRQRQWLDWLRHQAGIGNSDALALLRWRKPACNMDRAGINGSTHLQPRCSGRRHDSVTKQGTVIYRVGAGAVRDEGSALRVSRGAHQDVIEAALQMALERFGRRIVVKGSDGFKEQVVLAATAAKLPIVFEDPALEQRRVWHANPPIPRAHPVSDVGTHVPPTRNRATPEQVNDRNIRAPITGDSQKGNPTHARARR